MMGLDPRAALNICPVRAAGEEIDCAIEYTRSLVDMALDLGDLDWAEKAATAYRVLKAAQEAGIGRRRPVVSAGEGRVAA